MISLFNLDLYLILIILLVIFLKEKRKENPIFIAVKIFLKEVSIALQGFSLKGAL